MPTEDELDEETLEARREVLSELRSTSVGLDGCLEKTIPCGVAFHREYVLYLILGVVKSIAASFATKLSKTRLP